MSKSYLFCYLAHTEKYGNINGSIVLSLTHGLNNREAVDAVHSFIAETIEKDVDDPVDHIVLVSVTHLPEWDENTEESD